MVAQLKVNKKANNIIDLEEGEVEQTVCVELDGVKVKVRTDYNNQTAAIIGEHVIPFGLIVDVKTTSDPIDRRKYKAAIKILKEARRTGIYYSEDAIPTINLPYWARFEEIDNDRTSDDTTYTGVKETVRGSEEGDEGETIPPTYRPEGC